MKPKTTLILIICMSLIVCASSQKNIAKMKEKDPKHQFNLGLFYLKEGKIDEAIRYLNKAITLKPDYDHALCTLGLAHSMKGELQKSVDYLKQCLNINPGMTEAHNYLGVSYQELGFLEEAEKEFKIAILDTNYKSRELPYYNLARIYLSKNQLQESLDNIDRSLLFNENFRLAHNLRGTILEKQLKYSEAIESYKKALRNLQADVGLARNVAVEYYVTINFNLGVVYFKNKELKNAKEIFTRIYPMVTDQEMKVKIDQYLRVIK